VCGNVTGVTMENQQVANLQENAMCKKMQCKRSRQRRSGVRSGSRHPVQRRRRLCRQRQQRKIAKYRL